MRYRAVQMSDPQLHVRIPKELREALIAEAERQGVSLNNLVITLLAGGVAWRADNQKGATH